MHAQLLHAFAYTEYAETPVDKTTGLCDSVFSGVHTEYSWEKRTGCTEDFACGFAFTDLGDRKPVQMRYTARLNGQLSESKHFRLTDFYPYKTRFAETLVVRTCFEVTFDLPDDGLLLLTFHAILDDGSFIDVEGTSGIYVRYKDPAIQAETEDEVPIGATLFAARRKLIDDALRPE